MSNFALTEFNLLLLRTLVSIISVIVALFLGLRGDLRRWQNRPQVVLEQQDTRDRTYCQFNIKIINKGKTTARDINVKIESILQDGEPIRSGSFPYPINTAIHLQSEEYSLIRLLLVSQNPNNMEVGREGWYIDRNDSTLNVLITGDNITAIRYSYRYVDSTELNKVQLTKL